MKIKYKIPMQFRDGDDGRKMRPEFANKFTIDLILEGHRTGTSRDMSKAYNKHDIKVGDIVEFYSGSKRAFVQITKEPYPISNITPKEWSDLECWDDSVYLRLNRNYQQYQYKLIP
jgi:hypothetical protein